MELEPTMGFYQEIKVIKSDQREREFKEFLKLVQQSLEKDQMENLRKQNEILEQKIIPKDNQIHQGDYYEQKDLILKDKSSDKNIILEAITGCSRQQALDALNKCDNDLEKAELFIIEQRNQEEEMKNLQQLQEKEIQNQKQVELFQKNNNLSNKDAHEIMENCNFDIEKAQIILKQGQKVNVGSAEDMVDCIIVIFKCKKQTALKVIQHFPEFRTAENFLKTALDFCRGDEDQVIHLLSLDILELGCLNSLTKCQRQAVDFIAHIAREQHNLAYHNLVKRFFDLGHGEDTLQEVLRYIRDEAPIIIHFKTEHIQHFLKDTHYRSAFEVHKQANFGQGGRFNWESKLFNKIYDKCKEFERPKYGVLNIHNCPYGVKSCYGYGPNFFVLKEVRLRTTFVNQDSAGLASQQTAYKNIATCQYYGHVLVRFSDIELQGVIDIATKKAPFGTKDSQQLYKEVQIHGDVRFDRNIMSMCINVRDYNRPDVKKQLEQFKLKFKNIEIYDYEPDHQQNQPGMFGAGKGLFFGAPPYY